MLLTILRRESLLTHAWMIIPLPSEDGGCHGNGHAQHPFVVVGRAGACTANAHRVVG